MIDLSKRSTEDELMDDPNLPAADLDIALQDISRVNKLLGGNQITLKALEKIIAKYPKKNEWTIVDVGCGDGEMLRRIADRLDRHPIKMQLIGLDISENGIEMAKSKSKEYTNVTFLNQDILKLDKAAFSCDILICTLTLHHMSVSEVPLFMKKFINLANVAVIINDLERSSIAYVLFKLFSRIFIKSKIAKHDGLVSIASGFKKEELEALSKQLNVTSSVVSWKWAFRYLWLIKTI